jgi:hypothetical protein
MGELFADRKKSKLSRRVVALNNAINTPGISLALFKTFAQDLCPWGASSLISMMVTSFIYISEATSRS